MFQILFFSVVSCLIFAIEQKHIGFADIVKSFYAYWFVWAYLLLYALSPILNAFVEKATPKQLRNVLIVFYFIQTLDWIFPTYQEPFSSGYSTISFIGLYLLARYVRLYVAPVLTTKTYNLIAIYASLVLAHTMAVVAMAFSGREQLYDIGIEKVLDYTTPVSILSAVVLLLIFSRISIQSKVVNWIAGSSFAVYLLHTNVLLFDYFLGMVNGIYEMSNNAIGLMFIFLFLCVVFAVSVIIDQPRKWLWGKMSYRLDKSN